MDGLEGVGDANLEARGMRRKSRSKGEGSIDQLPSGKWRARVTVQDGRLSFTTEHKQEALTWLRKTAEQAEQGLSYKGARMSLAEYLEGWLASLSVRSSTMKSYEGMVRNHIKPSLGNVALKDLTTDRIQAAYDHWQRREKGAYAIRKAHDVLNQALGRAQATGLLIRNPCAHVIPPRAPHREMKFWTEEEAGRFLAAAMSSRLYGLFYLAIMTGMRQSELLGLKWIDLDWRRGSLHVRRQLARDRSFDALKTAAGNRTIKLGGQSLAVLHDHYNLQQQERQIAGRRWQENDLLFTSTIGTPHFHKNLLDDYFKPLLKASGVKPIRFHDLRHTAAAILLSRGTPIFTVSKLLGHARASITSDIYGHLVPGAADGLVETLEGLITPVEVDAKNWSRIGHELVMGEEEGESAEKNTPHIWGEK